MYRTVLVNAIALLYNNYAILLVCINSVFYFILLTIWCQLKQNHSLANSYSLLANLLSITFLPK